MIVFTGAELVTGNFLVFAILLIHEPTWKTFYESWRSFLVSWWGNFCGTMLVASCIAWQSGVVPPPTPSSTSAPPSSPPSPT